MDMHTGKILLAEDEESVRHMIRAFLEMEGYQVVAAGDGQEALEVYRRERPDLLISDIDMPYMTGIELASEIRRQDSGFPVILISGNLKSCDYIASDANISYLPKPFNWGELRREVDAALVGKPVEASA